MSPQRLSGAGMGIWRLPVALLAAVAIAWGGAEVLLRLRGPAEAPAQPPRTAQAPAQPPRAAPAPAPPPRAASGPASLREKAVEAAIPTPDKALPPEATGPGKGPEPGLALPRVITPDQDVRWGASLVTTGIRAVDGDSLARGEERLRLIGIDAPELNQTCRNPADNTLVACGRQAQGTLSALLRFGSITCTNQGTDRFGRTLARCLNGRAEEINRAMVLSGWALAAEGDPTYATEEQQAAAARRGLHALLFDRPEAWRRANPR